jgi:hypothetical protein
MAPLPGWAHLCSGSHHKSIWLRPYCAVQPEKSSNRMNPNYFFSSLPAVKSGRFFATISSQMTRPQITEAAPYYFKYIDLITDEEIVPAIQSQLGDTLHFLEGISEQKSLHSYAPGKWTIREVLNHVNDGERLFLGRALWFARGFSDPLPSFDQDLAVQNAHANETPWSQLVEEFRTVRLATISFFDNLPEEAWSLSGIASDNAFTVRSLAYIIAGHVAHHRQVLKEKYL